MDVVSEVEKVSTLTKWTLFSGQLTSYSETSHLSPEHVVGLAEQVANIVAQKRSTRLEELEHPTGGAGALDWRSWSTRLEELEQDAVRLTNRLQSLEEKVGLLESQINGILFYNLSCR